MLLIPTQVLVKADQCDECVRRRKNSQQKERVGHRLVKSLSPALVCSLLSARFSQSLLLTNRVAGIKSYHIIPRRTPRANISLCGKEARLNV